MLNLKVLGTGSSGNCYLLEYGERTLILDCGINYNEILVGLDFNIKKIDAVLCTHFHSDHVLSASKFEKMGIPVWKPYLETEKKIQKKVFGEFTVTCFDVPHDGVENRGFLIQVGEEKLLYVTDFEYIPYNFKKQKINYMLIECNYIKELVDVDAENFNHVFRGHAELQTTIDAIKANYTNELCNVIICHISSQNMDKDKLLNEVKKVSNFDVKIAHKGMEEELSLVPF